MTKAGMKTLIADGENFRDPDEFDPYLKPRRLMDVLQLDIRNGGLLKCREVGRMAKAAGAQTANRITGRPKSASSRRCIWQKRVLESAAWKTTAPPAMSYLCPRATRFEATVSTPFPIHRGSPSVSTKRRTRQKYKAKEIILT